MALIGPSPIDTVGYSQKSGMRRGWGYEESPFPPTSNRKLSSCSSVRRPSTKRTRVDARRGMALEVDLITGCAVVLAAEEVVEADLVERGGAGVGGEVAADRLRTDVGPDHHDRGVPPDEGADAALEVLVARELRLHVGGDGVDIGGRDGGGEVDVGLARPFEEAHEQVAGTVPSAGTDDVVERGEPLRGLLGVVVGQLVGHTVEQHPVHAPTAHPRDKVKSRARVRRAPGRSGMLSR